MKITQHLLLSAALIGLFSCSDSDSATTETTNAAPTTVSAESTPDGLTEPVPTVTPEPAQATASGLNPAHGEPGHRCDIAVGAPLDSPPGQNTNAAPAATVTPTQPPAVTLPNPAPVQPTAASGSGKINPPHGQPGHDCSKPVGQPL